MRKKQEKKDNYIQYLDGQISYNSYLKADSDELRNKASRKEKIGAGLGAAAAVVALATGIHRFSEDPTPKKVISITREASNADGSYIETRVEEIHKNETKKDDIPPMDPIDVVGLGGLILLGTGAGIALEEAQSDKQEARHLAKSAVSQPDHTYPGQNQMRAN